jgi:hypothetical protein
MLKRTFSLLAVATVTLLMSAAAASASVPAHPSFESSAKAGQWNHDGYLFQNDMWNCPQAACGKQTIWANSRNNWGAVATMAAGNTAVLTYPNLGKLYNNQPVSHFKQVSDTFTESMPRATKGLSAEAADDVWLNNYNIEMMIWVDNAGRSLAGSTRVGSATIFGQHFTVWKFGSSEFIFDLNHNETKGSTHILSSIAWLVQHGKVPADPKLTQAEFGWEIASTGGKAASFAMSRFALTTKTR